MRMSRLVGTRFKERPAEAALESHAFLLRGGYARQVANGIYSLLPPGLRVVRRIENILREEMDRIGGQEIQMPVVQPRELWDESGRYDAVGPELARFCDRTRHDMVLAMTHEEAVVHLVRGEISSYAQLPFMVYQIQTKFRDEPRSRGGLIRVREFTMKDAYSFHATPEDLADFYQKCFEAYRHIFVRAGLPEVVAVESDTGMMGGRVAHEFILLCEAGEDTIAVSEDGSRMANLEVASGRVPPFPADPLPLEKVHTPAMKTIEDVAGLLGVPTRQTAKAVFYENDSEGRLVLVVVRGDREVNESKLARLIGVMPQPATEEKILAAGVVPGFASPMGVDPVHCRIVIDHTVRESGNLVTGANETDHHYRNFNLNRDLAGTGTVDVVQVADGDLTPGGDSKYRLVRGIEVGNIFQLGTKYSSAMRMTYTDREGRPQLPLMGCYGIGVGRLMCSIMEVRRDKFGPIWPVTVAPWQVHLNALNMPAAGVRETAEQIYCDLCEAGIDVLYDDRNATAGVQFAEADLLGAPFRLIVGERNLKEGRVEWKRRDTGEKGTVPVVEVASTFRGWIDHAIGNP